MCLRSRTGWTAPAKRRPPETALLQQRSTFSKHVIHATYCTPAHAYHQRYTVARQTVGKELSELAIPVGDVNAAVALLLRAELRDAVSEDHEALVNVVCLFESLALAARLLRHLGASQVDEIDLSMPRDVNALVVLVRRLLLGVNVHRQYRVRPGRVLVHVVVSDGTVLQP